MKASREGHADVVELLLFKGANIHDKTNRDCSSIMLALDHSTNFGTNSTNYQ